LPEPETPVKGFDGSNDDPLDYFTAREGLLSVRITSDRPLVIAVDGPAASGKGTIAKALARHFGLNHLDTGALYRAVALQTLRQGLSPDDPVAALAAAQVLAPETLSDPALRNAETGAAASKVAAFPAVRDQLLTFQRSFAQTAPGAVLDGRDIGTVICPDAPAKLFVTASLEQRALRRHRELVAMGADIDLSQVHDDLVERDRRDSNRNTAPLLKASDAGLLDTTELSIEAAVATAIDLISRKLDAGAGP
jgi:cytidylate kinase